MVTEVKEATSIVPVSTIIEIMSLQDTAREVVVINDTQYRSAVDLLGRIKSVRTALEDARVWLTKPLNDHISSINAQYKSKIATLDEARKTIESKAVAWMDSERRRVEAEKQAALEAAKAAETTIPKTADGQLVNVETGAVVEVIPATVHTPGGSGSGRINWKYRILDVNLIPREYMIPNEVAIGAAVRTLKDKANIPGVEVYSEGGLNIRASGR